MLDDDRMFFSRTGHRQRYPLNTVMKCGIGQENERQNTLCV